MILILTRWNIRLGAYIMSVLAGAFALTISMAPGGASEIHVFSGAAPQSALRDLAPEFERATGHRIKFTFRIVGEIQQKLAAGESADLILLPAPLIAATEKTVPLRSEGKIVLARVGIGVIVPQGAPRPDISTVDAVRRMLLDARSIAWPDPSTPIGGHLNRAIEQLGIADQLRPKLIVKAVIHGGAEAVVKREADLGLYLVSEVQPIKGITLVGLLPPALQTFVVYGTAVPTSNAAPEAALAFVKFISDPARGRQWRAAGFELIGTGN
jgi:molybdate transport system substrate-binding protein